MQNRDSFQRQTSPFQGPGGTRPLNPGGTRPLLDPSALKAQLEDVIAKAKQSIENLEPRIELLLRACRNQDVQVPGVEDRELRHPLTPKGEKILVYLEKILRTNPAIGREVQVASFRFREAERALEAAIDGMEQQLLHSGLLEELRLKLFYLSRFHEGFRADPVLTQLFPPPEPAAGNTSNTGGTGSAALSNVDRLKQKQAREALLMKVETFSSGLAPKMEVLNLALEMLDKPGLNIGALFTPATRQARMLAFGLGSEKALLAQLREACALYGKLQSQLAEARRGGDTDPLKETIYPLSRLTIACRQHALLKDLFPMGEQELFPDS